MREEELQGDLKINEYQEISQDEIYSEKLSTKEYEQILQEQRENSFSIGEPILFNMDNAELEFPILLNAKGQKVTKKDKFGNILYEKDTDKEPFFKFSKYHNNNKAISNVPLPVFIDMLEDLSTKTQNKTIQDILDTVFPYEVIDYGVFTENGERKLNTNRISVLYQSKIVLRTLPLLNDKEEPITFVFTWLDEKGEHSINICKYAGKPLLGAMLGYKTK